VSIRLFILAMNSIQLLNFVKMKKLIKIIPIKIIIKCFLVNKPMKKIPTSMILLNWRMFQKKLCKYWRLLKRNKISTKPRKSMRKSEMPFTKLRVANQWINIQREHLPKILHLKSVILWWFKKKNLSTLMKIKWKEIKWRRNLKIFRYTISWKCNNHNQQN